MADIDRVVSFSVKPEDLDGRENVRKLKEYCKQNDKSFSLLVLKAIKYLNEKLELDGKPQPTVKRR